MALTDAQKLSIARILGITPSVLDAQIATLSLDAATETAVVAEITRWDTSGAKFTKLHPKESNKGAETFPEAVKNDIRKNLSLLLEFYTASYSSGMGTLRIGV